MRILELQIQDFLSIGKVLVSFPSTGAMLLDGWNADTQSANGAGKSSLLSAIAWCLFGKLPRDITATGVTRIGQKSVSVTVKLTSLSGETLAVSRRRPGGLEVVSDTGLKITSQEELESKLGLTYEQYLHTAYFAQGLGSRFVDLSDTDRKQMFLDLSKSRNYSSAKEKVDAEIKQIAKNIQEAKLDQARVSSRISEIEETIVDPVPIAAEVFISQQQVVDLNKQLKSIDVTPPDTSKFKDLKVRLKQELNSVNDAKVELRSLHNSLRKLQQPTNDIEPAECPHCSKHVIIDGDTLTACNKEAIDRARQTRAKQLEDQQQDIKSKILEIDKTVAKEPRILETIEKCDEKIADVSTEYRNNKSLVETIVQRTSTLEFKIKQLSEQLGTIEKTKIRLSELKAKESALSESIVDGESRLLLMQATSHALGPAGIQAYVLDSIVDEFNLKIDEVLSTSWPQFKYELLTFKEGKTGSISTRFSDSVSIDGHQRSMGSLSGGERRCLSLSIDIALSRVFSNHAGFLPSPIILDEPFDHLDSVNRERAISVVQELASDCCVVVVDHQNETKGMFEHTIEVTKQSGISSARIVSSNGG